MGCLPLFHSFGQTCGLNAAVTAGACLPGEWLWLRDWFARLSGLRITARKLAASLAGAVAALYLASGLFVVQPGEVGVRLRFGEIVAPDLAPGLHYRLPWPLGDHRIVAVNRIQRMEYGIPVKQPRLAEARPMNREGGIAGWSPAQTNRNPTGVWLQKEPAPEEPFLLTGDGNLINLRWAVQYRVKDAIAYAFNIAEPDAFVRSVGLTALRDVVARSGIDAIYTAERSSVEERVQRGLQERLDRTRTGIEVVSFKLLYVHPPDEVHDSFRDVASAQEDKLRTVNRANIFAVETVSQAHGEAAAMIEQALGFREQQILHAQGDAASFALRLSAYRQSPELTRFRLQVEAIEETLPGLPKFVTPAASDMKDFDMWLLQPVPASRSR